MAGPYVGQLGAMGIAKESVLATFVNPTRFIPVHLPCTIGAPDIHQLLSKGVRGVPDAVYKAQQGARMMRSGKMKFEFEPDNCGEILQATFGADTATQVASLTVTTGVNDTIDFICAAGTKAAAITAGTYAPGVNSGTDAHTTLCYLISAGMVAQDGAHTYTVTYSATTQEFTIATSQNSGTFSLLFHSGTNNAKTIAPLIGFITSADQTGAFTYTGNILVVSGTLHTMTRTAVAQLPTYSLWGYNGLTYPAWAGCMLNKLDFDIKANEFVIVDADWGGSKWNGYNSSKTLSYSALNPFKFDQLAITVGGTQYYDTEQIKISIDNKVKIDPVIGGSIDSNVIYSEMFDVKMTYVVVAEDTTELTKFINGTVSSFTLVATSAATFASAALNYTMTWTIPSAWYTAAVVPLPNGLVKITFQVQSIYNTTNAYSMQVALQNDVQTTY
jgi:hypothetical protein